MEWLEVSIQVNGEAAEAVAEVLSRYAPQGVAFDLSVDDSVPDGIGSSPVTVKAYLTVDEDIHERRRKVEAGLGHLRHIWPVIPEPVFKPVQDQDWTALWKEQIPVLHLGRRMVIKPSWRSYTPAQDELILEMDPGIAFGTGLHPTTQLCVLATEALVKPNAEVLDLGTGTGILAMTAAKLGAGHILAVDNDEDAIIAAQHNADANQLSDRIDLVRGSLEHVSAAYDLVLANILAPIIISMARSGLAERVRHGGSLVVSG
ncbi:MAG: 50S ribosomal protein L11 methyltransferase, partial [Anaerolineae bacterium]|nr:50S ribosomal protein L11 methyltransferase [Anaerolineae bacterium]